MDTTSTKSPYDVILGSNFQSLLGIVLNYNQGIIHWDDGTDDVPMKTLEALTDNTICKDIYYFAHTQPPLLQELEERQQKILDAGYSKLDIGSTVDDLPISLKSKQQLKTTLNNSPILFGDRMGLLKIKHVIIEIQKGAKHYSGRHYSIPKSMEEPLRKEIHRICQEAVLEELSYDDDPRWALPIFAQPRK